MCTNRANILFEIVLLENDNKIISQEIINIIVLLGNYYQPITITLECSITLGMRLSVSVSAIELQSCDIIVVDYNSFRKAFLRTALQI